MGGKKRSKQNQAAAKSTEQKDNQSKDLDANKETLESQIVQNGEENAVAETRVESEIEEASKKIEMDDQTENSSKLIEPSESATHEQQEQKLVNITIKDLNGRDIKLKMLQYELILELREFLSEHVYTCFFTNYYLEHGGIKLSDYSNLAEMDLDTDPFIYMKPQLYTENSARAHIKRCNEILTEPCLLNAQQNISKEEEHMNKIFDEGKAQGLGDEELASKQDEYIKEVTQKQDEKQRQMYEQFMKIVQKDQTVDHGIPQKKQASFDGSEPIQGAQQTLVELEQTTIEKEIKKTLQNSQYTKCIESIQFSCFNPVPNSRKLAGDLFYLTVKSLDAGERGITCSVNGFYLNDSIERTNFSPGPSQRNYNDGKVNKGFSYTLVGCIHQLSPLFTKNLEIYINQILNTEQYFLTQPPLKVHHWAQEDDRKSNRICSQGKLSEVVNPLFGLDPKGIRDWNEEYQVVKDFPKENMAQRAQRDRAISKIYNDFLNAATEGAIAIVKGSISPLNPTEQKKQQVFVYNLIFFSFAIDSYDSFKDLTSSDQNPSWTQANHDLSGLRQLQQLEVDGLHYVATAIINYRGHRIIAQSIIPGILNNSELSSLAEYGTVDEQKTIQSNEQFHTLMKKVAGKLGVQVNKILDAQGKAVEIAGCVEIKGIRGTDKRCYIVDLQGMTPRDANYLGDEHHTCLVRQELINSYMRDKSLNHAKEMMIEADKLLEEEKNNRQPKVEEGKEYTDEQKKEYQELIMELNKKRQTNFQNFIKDLDREVFNTNVFKKIKLAMSEEEVKSEEDKVQALATYLKETAIQNLIVNLQKTENIPTNSVTLSEFFHQNGVNIRYLGYIADQVKDKNMAQTKFLLEREVFVRCMKHIVNMYVRDFPSDELISDLISHLFNCVFSPSEFLNAMNDDKMQYGQETMEQKSNQSIQDGEKIIKARLKAAQSEKENKNTSVSKKEKKRQKREAALQLSARGERSGQDQIIAEEDTQKDDEVVEIEELLFKQTHIDFTFESNEIFLDPSVSFGLYSQEVKDVFKLKPSDLYSEVIRLASKRYNYNLLPDNLSKLKCLESPGNKLSILRDICLCTGIKLNLSNENELILDNDATSNRQKVTARVHYQNKNVKQIKKKGQNQQDLPLLSDEEFFMYANLPFQKTIVADFNPIVKHLNYKNQDAVTMMQEAIAASNDLQYEKAFDLYNQIVNLLLQVTGAMNPEVASCITKMANIQYKMGDFLQAIELQTKSIIIQEKISGYDNPQLAYSYSNLGLYYHQCRYWSKGFEYLNRSKNILQVVSGDNHPDVTSVLLNLGLMYQDCDQFQSAIDLFTDCLYRNISLYGNSHFQVVSCYQAIAHAYYLQENYRMALEYQEKNHDLLKQLVPADSQYLLHSENQINQFIELSVAQEKAKQAEKAGQRSIGSNKTSKKSQKELKLMEEQQRYEDQQRTNKKNKKILARQQNRGGFLDMLEQRYRHQQFQDMMKKVQDQTEQAEVAPKQEEGLAPTAAAGKQKETLLSKAARENKVHMEALASELEKNGGETINEDEALNSARSGGDPSLQQSKKRKKKSKK